MRTFKYPKTILEHHLDTFGHVNNAVYLELYEEARWEFITQNGFGLDRIQKEQIGPVVLEAHVAFRQELGNREQVTITSSFQQMKNSKVMILEQQILRDDDSLASSAEIHVGILDMQKRRLISPSDEWMKAIQ